MTSFIGLLLWVTPVVAYRVIDAIIFKGASWWWWLAVVALSVSFNALLDWYVRESYRAAVRQGRVQ